MYWKVSALQVCFGRLCVVTGMCPGLENKTTFLSAVSYSRGSRQDGFEKIINFLSPRFYFVQKPHTCCHLHVNIANSDAIYWSSINVCIRLKNWPLESFPKLGDMECDNSGNVTIVEKCDSDSSATPTKFRKSWLHGTPTPGIASPLIGQSER